MKLSCDIAQDLLPLYEEELCSLGSRTAIEKHLEECAECRKLVEGMQVLSGMTASEMVEEEKECSNTSDAASRQTAAIAGSLRKIKHRWFKSLVWVAVLLPAFFDLGIMIFNQVQGQGICFTNLDEIMTVYRFANAMERGDYETAVEFMNYEKLYEEIQGLVVDFSAEEDVFVKGEEYNHLKEEYEKAAAMSMEEFTEVVKQRCLADMLECREQNISFENKGYVFSYFISENEKWVVDYCFLVSKDEEQCRITFGFSIMDGKISMGSSSSETEVEWYNTVLEALDLYYLY